MFDQTCKEHALSEFFKTLPATSHSDERVLVTVEPDMAYTSVRVNLHDSVWVQSIERTVSQMLPKVANTVTRGEHTIYWQGPTEFLIASPATSDQYDALVLSAGKYDGVTRLNGGLIKLHIAGAKAQDLLEKGSTLDLHAREFLEHHCAQSTFAKAAALVARRAENDGFELIVRRSFADYVALWLQRAGAEFGVRFAQISAHA